MLNRLMEFGIEKEFFEIVPLGKLSPSHVNSKTEVIDFDKTKEAVSAKYALQHPKSADALKILPHLNRIAFIELKGFEEFCNRNKNQSNVDDAISHQIKKFNLPKKIKDSLFLLNVLINSKDFKCTKPESAQFECVTKGCIVVIDIELNRDPIKDRLATLTFLADGMNLQHKILEELEQTISNIPESSLENFEKPRLFSCSKIDSHYSTLSI